MITGRYIDPKTDFGFRKKVEKKVVANKQQRLRAPCWNVDWT